MFVGRSRSFSVVGDWQQLIMRVATARDRGWGGRFVAERGLSGLPTGRTSELADKVNQIGKMY